MQNPFRNLPSVNQLLESPPLKKLVETVNHRFVVDGVRNFLEDLRAQVTHAAEDVVIPTAQELAVKIADWLETAERPSLRPVINATGIILHTGLGRAPLSQDAIQAIHQIASGYSSVEMDLATGQRGQRSAAVERLLCELTGAEAAVVVNNNAAATMITLSSLAKGREVIVSRGQLIEIGGSYRLPDVMETSGAILREVGTTNKTRGADYENAIDASGRTAALMRVHPSNFEVVGFTESVSIKELVAVAKKHGLPVIDDIGSGALVNFEKYGLAGEPLARDSVSAGADVVLFSGDKLVGGPQCGIIVGKRHCIQKILKNPLMRAMRVGKLTLSALAATLRLYRNPQQAEQDIPLLRMLSMPLENLKLRADKLVGQISHLPKIKSIEVIQEHSMLGGGSVPAQKIPTWCAAITPAGVSVDRLASRLRDASPAVIGRVTHDRLLLDFRTIDPAWDMRLVEIFEELDRVKPNSAASTPASSGPNGQ